MKNPFFFGKMVEGSRFTDREVETQRLLSNFDSGINTILISPRRWGKSSLVKKAGEIALKSGMKVVWLDAFSIRTEQEFYTEYAQAVVKASSSKWEDWMEVLKQSLKQVVPKITIGADPLTSFSVHFDWQEVAKNVNEILDLPERIARSKNIRMVVCIDEFQNISSFPQSLAFQKQLRSVWQKHQSVGYCLYGSKFHMMQELFERQSMPFFRFGDLMHLNRIAEEHWVSYIHQQFRVTGKRIDDSIVYRIISVVNSHAYYVQQLSHLIWARTDKAVTLAIFDEAIEDMLNQNAILYQRDTEDLSATQLNFLKAVASGETTNLNRASLLSRYRLGTSANVTKIKKQLLNREIIDIRKKIVSFIDPVYELWFKREIL